MRKTQVTGLIFCLLVSAAVTLRPATAATRIPKQLLSDLNAMTSLRSVESSLTATTLEPKNAYPTTRSLVEYEAPNRTESLPLSVHVGHEHLSSTISIGYAQFTWIAPPNTNPGYTVVHLPHSTSAASQAQAAVFQPFNAIEKATTFQYKSGRYYFSGDGYRGNVLTRGHLIVAILYVYASVENPSKKPFTEELNYAYSRFNARVTILPPPKSLLYKGIVRQVG